jgi:hypothetical protein
MKWDGGGMMRGGEKAKNSTEQIADFELRLATCNLQPAIYNFKHQSSPHHLTNQ